MPSSSWSSRASAASGDSPGSRLPPGNSHRPARSRPSVRRASRMRPALSRMTPATTSTGAPDSPLTSGELAVAVLVLLAAAAGAGIVAADALAAARRQHFERGHRALRLRGFFVGAQATHVGVLELHLAGHRLGARALGGFGLRDLFLAADAHARQQRNDFALHLLE